MEITSSLKTFFRFRELPDSLALGASLGRLEGRIEVVIVKQLMIEISEAEHEHSTA